MTDSSRYFVCVCVNECVYVCVQKEPYLTWAQRSKILKDVCRGMQWLHSAKPPLVHGDVKAYVPCLN